MKTKNYHYVYKITNHNPVDSRKFYIGVRTTKGRLPEDDINYMGSSDTLTAAIKTQGKKYFSKEILSVWQSKDDAYAEETWNIIIMLTKRALNFVRMVGL
jgi:predicted nucleic acid-binding protein